MNYIGSTLEDHSRQFPDKLAVVSEKDRITYKEFNELVTGYQQALLKYTGVHKKRIGIKVEDPPAFLALFMATAGNGWEAMPIDPKWTDAEIRHAYAVASPDYIVTDGEEAEEDDRVIAIRRLREAGRGHALVSPPAPLDDFYVGFTSGSSGKPKGFTRHHLSWTESFSVCEEIFQLTQRDIITSPGPLYHSLSLFTAVHAIQLGATLHVTDAFHRKTLLDRLEKDEIDTFVGVPTMLEALMEECRSRSLQLQGIKKVIVSGAGWSQTSKEKARCFFPEASFLEYYGASELSFVMYKKDREQGHRPFPNVSVRILNEHFKETDCKEAGNVFVRSPMLFTGYLGLPEETKEVLTPYGATVGDVGYKNENGEVVLVGRKSNMIKSGGLKVYPEEVEAVLESHPDIEASIVYPVEDPYWGEMVVCSLQLKNKACLTAEDVRNFCRGKLSDYKVPKQILPLSVFHYTKSGKINRKATLEGRTL
ncbi:AMP-binding protein [Bacillus sp. KH172YL63]|uniref:AMP-binding protein n=1 Tax=Bacillus sp. KH172YL63 TaxID=2709784 RepID=UPI0013E4EEEA|nr:AMP-binding protein [Bacillus sp. KH172YL63]BCB02895.1 acyl-CoA synthetase [Bacillus sp. KH172YL63]